MKKEWKTVSWETWKIWSPYSRCTLQFHLSCMSQTELNVHLLLPFSPPSDISEYLEGMHLLFCKGAIKRWGNGSSKRDTYSNNVDFRKTICSQADPHKNAWLGHWKIIEWMIFFTRCLQVFPQQYKYFCQVKKVSVQCESQICNNDLRCWKHTCDTSCTGIFHEYFHQEKQASLVNMIIHFFFLVEKTILLFISVAS